MKKTVVNFDATPICRRLKELRLKLGFNSKTKFSSILGVLPQTYQNYENDRIPPSEFLFKLVDKFKHDVDLGWLLTGQGTAPDKRHDDELSDTANAGSMAEQQTQRNNIIEIEHSNLIKQFRDKELAKTINENLIRLEGINEEAFREVGAYIKGMVQFESNPVLEKSADNPIAQDFDDFDKMTSMFIQKTTMHRLEVLEAKLEDIARRTELLEKQGAPAKAKTGTSNN